MPSARLPGLILVATFFALAAGNGYRIWLSSLPFVVVLALLACAVRGRGDPGARPLAGFTGWVFAAVSVLAVAATSSWLATGPDADSSAAFAGSFLSPLVVTIAMLGRWEEEDLWRVVTAMLVGASIVLAHGIVRFYAEFGIPTGLDLVFARAQEVKIEPYLRATWGNVGSTAAYIALLLPLALATALWREAPRSARRLSQLFIVLSLLNFAVIQSRTLLLVVTASLIVVARAFQTRFRTVLMVAVAALGLLMIPLFTVLDTLFAYLAGALQGSSGDASVAERAEAMQIGWRLMWDNPLQGVGPGRTVLLNPYTSAHEFAVEVGSELGVPGFLAAALATVATWHVFRGALRRGATPAGRLAIVLSIGPAGYMLYAFLANAPLSQGAVISWAGLWAGLLTLAAGWLDRIDGNQAGAANDDRPRERVRQNGMTSL